MKFSNNAGKITFNTSGKTGNMNRFIYGTQRAGTNRVGRKSKRKVRKR